MVTKQKLSVQEYLAMPEEPPYSEYVYGEAVQKMAPQRKHVSLVEESATSSAATGGESAGFPAPNCG